MKCPNRNCKVGNQNRAWIIYENKKNLRLSYLISDQKAFKKLALVFDVVFPRLFIIQ